MITNTLGSGRSFRRLIAMAFAVVCGAKATAQCTTTWGAMGAVPMSGQIEALAGWDPDGSGPLVARLVAGGRLTVGGVSAGGVAVCDLATSTWSALGGGTDGAVESLCALANGDLVVAGPFTAAGGVAAGGIARWNGSTWAALGGGLTVASGALQVRAVISLSNGDLVVAGNFTAAGGVAANGLARWNGSSWAAIPAVLTGGNQNLTSLAALPNGEFAVGGDFTAIGGVPAASVARWNGSAWAPFGAGFAGGIRSLAVTGNGALVAAGHLFTGGGFVSQWGGSSWQPLATLSGTSVSALVGLAGHGVAAAGTFATLGGAAAVGVAQFDGVAWGALGAGLPGAGGSPNVTALAALPGGQLAAVTDYGPTRWDGAVWRPLAVGPQIVVSLLPEPDGSVLASGSFVTPAGHANLCRWNGATWTPVASPLRYIRAMARRSNGNLVVAGDGLAEWNGTSWSVAGNLTIYNGILALLALPAGDVLVAGQFAAGAGGSITNIARWNGSTWSSLGAGLGSFVTDPVRTLALLPGGDVVAGGDFTTTGTGLAANRIARWNGTTWSPLGLGLNNLVFSVVTAPNGDLYAAGTFTQAGSVPAANVARWNGTAWSALPGLPASQGLRLAMLPDGDLVAAGQTWPTATSQPLVARWNGAGWTRLDAGVGAQPTGGAWSVAFGGEGLYVGGLFTSAGGAPATGIVRLASSCPAVVLPWGSGCAGSTLTATAPWLGSTLRTTGTVPAGPAAGFLVHGFQPTSVPLPPVWSAFLPGCELTVQPEYVAFVPFAGGTATSSLAVPNTAALTGLVLRQQMLAVELSGTMTASASNALLLTLGRF
ncbi:MAG: hypothetical protein FJ306_01535 [Planctomycetes bacterium]|nr:hypothetical protein [Planctomycetota bacterium]